jgi:hypothetical protein
MEVSSPPLFVQPPHLLSIYPPSLPPSPPPSQDCDLDYVPNKAIKHDINVAISDNLG